eukprot:g324.t1
MQLDRALDQTLAVQVLIALVSMVMAILLIEESWDGEGRHYRLSPSSVAAGSTASDNATTAPTATTATTTTTTATTSAAVAAGGDVWWQQPVLVTFSFLFVATLLVEYRLNTMNRAEDPTADRSLCSPASRRPDDVPNKRHRPRQCCGEGGGGGGGGGSSGCWQSWSGMIEQKVPLTLEVALGLCTAYPGVSPLMAAFTFFRTWHVFKLLRFLPKNATMRRYTVLAGHAPPQDATTCLKSLLRTQPWGAVILLTVVWVPVLSFMVLAVERFAGYTEGNDGHPETLWETTWIMLYMVAIGETYESSVMKDHMRLSRVLAMLAAIIATILTTMLFTAIMQSIEGSAGNEAMIQAAAGEAFKEDAKQTAGRILLLWFCKRPSSTIVAPPGLLAREDELRARFKGIIEEIKELRAAEEEGPPSAAQMTQQLLGAIADVSDNIGLFQQQAGIRFRRLDTRVDVLEQNTTRRIEELLRSQASQIRSEDSVLARQMGSVERRLGTTNAKVEALKSRVEERLAAQEEQLLSRIGRTEGRLASRVGALESTTQAVAERVGEVHRGVDEGDGEGGGGGGEGKR